MSAAVNSARVVPNLAEPVRLSDGEVIRYQAEFSPHAVLSHLKVALVLTDRRVIVQRPHTLFGVIPHGYSEQSSPLGTVCEVIAGRQVSSRKLVQGTFAGLFALWMLFGLGGPVGILLGLIFLALAGLAFYTSQTMGIFVRNHGAGILAAPAGRMDHATVERTKDALAQVLYPATSQATL